MLALEAGYRCLPALKQYGGDCTVYTTSQISDATALAPSQPQIPQHEADMVKFIGYLLEIFDQSIPDEELKNIVVLDAEWGKEFVESVQGGAKVLHAYDRLSDLGVWVLCLAAVRKPLLVNAQLGVKMLATMQTVLLRVLENAKFQHPGETDRGEFLYMAPYLEFGRKIWVHKDRLQDKISTTIRDLLKESMPEVSFTDPQIILMAHASQNDEKQLANAKINLNKVLNVVAKFDTQQLARVYMNSSQPGLGELCNALNIRLVAKHNGGNDTTYTLAIILAIALWYGASKSLLSVTGTPLSDIGSVVESLRNPHYEFTDPTQLATFQQICEFCGLTNHAATMCRCRCGCCLEKFSGHTCNNCPMRSQLAVQAGGPHYYLLPKMLEGQTNGFLHENDRTKREKQATLAQVATVTFGKKLSQKERKRLEKEKRGL